MSISGISQLLPTQFWPNFKGRFQKKILLIFRTWSFYPKILYPKFVRLKICWTPKFFGPKVFLEVNFSNLYFFDQNFLEPNFILTQNFFGSKTFRSNVTWIVFWNKNLFDLIFLTKTTTITTLMGFNTIIINLVFLNF